MHTMKTRFKPDQAAVLIERAVEMATEPCGCGGAHKNGHPDLRCRACQNSGTVVASKRTGPWKPRVVTIHHIEWRRGGIFYVLDTAGDYEPPREDLFASMADAEHECRLRNEGHTK